MNSRQKEVLEQSLQDEQAVLDALKKNYTEALAEIKRNIKELQSNPLTQSKAYQLEFQKNLETQISGIIDRLQGKNFTSVSEYLQTCYQNGFIGTMYSIQGSGIPLIIPIDETQVIKAVQKTGDDFKLANKLGVSTKALKNQVKSELQRGLATQLSYADIARNISDYGQSNMNRSMLIARTEGHRVQNQSSMDAMKAAKNKGADIVKQWDSTLDGKTRDDHRLLDGQIRELEEPFEVSGKKAMEPGGFGDPAEDCNCRCCVLERSRSALKLTENGYQKWNNEDGFLIKTTGYKDFEQKYLKAASNMASKTDITEGGKFIRWAVSDKQKYADLIEHEYITQKATRKEVEQLWQKDGGYIQNSEGYKDINDYLRGQKPKIDNPKCAITEKVMNRLTNNNQLQVDHIGIRKVDMNYLEKVLGLDISDTWKYGRQKTSQDRSRKVMIPKDKAAAQSIVDQINNRVGTPAGSVPDGAYTSFSLSEKLNFFTHYPVQFEVQLPKGTKGFITSNLDESEYIA